jgi:hypothetical protein
VRDAVELAGAAGLRLPSEDEWDYCASAGLGLADIRDAPGEFVSCLSERYDGRLRRFQSDVVWRAGFYAGAVKGGGDMGRSVGLSSFSLEDMALRLVLDPSPGHGRRAVANSKVGNK